VTVLPPREAAFTRSSGRTPQQEVHDMLADARDRVRHLVAEETVDLVTVAGDPVDALLAQAADARLLVVGKRGLGGFARLMVGSTSIALAGRSPVPVAIVPDLWTPDLHTARPVVVGIDPAKADHHPIDVAFRRARRLGVTLIAVHGWEAPPLHSWDVATTAGAVSEAEHVALAGFDAVLATWTARYPDVPVRPMRARQHPAAAILDAAEEAQVIVLGRHPEGVFGGFAFGSVARTVLHYAERPVIAVPSNGTDGS
jgi:nucleotide-binding universal stress UspA family protein